MLPSQGRETGSTPVSRSSSADVAQWHPPTHKALEDKGAVALLAQRQSSGIVNRRCQFNSDKGLKGYRLRTTKLLAKWYSSPIIGS